MVREWGVVERFVFIRFSVWEICLNWIRSCWCVGGCVWEGCYGEEDCWIEEEMVRC